MSFVAESPLTGPGRGWLHARAHGGGREPPARLLRGGARARASPSPSPSRWCRSTSSSPRAPCSGSTAVRPPAAPTAPPPAWPRRCAGSAPSSWPTSPQRRRGPRGRGSRWSRCRRSCWASSGRSSAPRPRSRRCTSRTAARGARASGSPARAGRPAGAPGRGGPGLPLQRRRGRRGQRLGAGAGRAAHPRGPRGLRGHRAPAGASASFRGRQVLTNPPPSSGGILIADALELLERLDRPGDTRALAEVIASTNRARDEEFLHGLTSHDFAERFLAEDVLDGVATEIGSRLGSTTASGRAWTPRAAAPRSPAPTGRARAWWCPAPACT